VATAVRPDSRRVFCSSERPCDACNELVEGNGQPSGLQGTGGRNVAADGRSKAFVYEQDRPRQGVQTTAPCNRRTTTPPAAESRRPAAEEAGAVSTAAAQAEKFVRQHRAGHDNRAQGVTRWR